MRGTPNLANCDATAIDAPAAVQPLVVRCPRVNVLGTAVDAVNMEEALSQIALRLKYGNKGYICAVSVHGILEALRDSQVASALAGAALALPDGTPTVWVGRLRGHRTMDHVTGPAIMRQIFRRAEFSGYSHFFYGGKPGVADDLAAKICSQHPWIKVAGTDTPPFRPLTRDEEMRLIAKINRLCPDIIWVGISTPRQDLFMRHILPSLNTRMMFGVGAAFDFLTGRVHNCPAWIKCAGFNWLHRLMQDPRRLWRRNLQNTAFLWHIVLQLSELRKYPLPPSCRDREVEIETLSTPDCIN